LEVLLKRVVAIDIILILILFATSIFLFVQRGGPLAKPLAKPLTKKNAYILISSFSAMIVFGIYALDYILAFLPLRSPFTTFMIEGRPLRRHGGIYRSDTTNSDDWILDDQFPTPPSHSWLDAARGEHSSVAAFAKLSLELGALGCPPELLAGAHRAALDEINHAQVAFTLDAANGPAKGPAPEKGFFGEAGHIFRVQKMALETFTDGCLHEARSALALQKRAAEEPDAAIKKEIERITAEEQTHVDLAWKIVKWCFAELKLDTHRARLFRQLTRILDATEKREGGDADHRAIFERARVSLSEIYSPSL
jgi:hypothetical protein